MPDFPSLSTNEPSLDDAMTQQTMAAFVHESTVWMENILALLGEVVASQTALTEIVESLSEEIAALSANAIADRPRDVARAPTALHSASARHGDQPRADAA